MNDQLRYTINWARNAVALAAIALFWTYPAQASELDDAINAVECALEMGESLEELNEIWRREGSPTGRMRIGILTGPGVVGALGSRDRMKYATVGNTVNTASRLESFDKETFTNEPERSTCRVLVGHATFERLEGRFVTKDLGEHMLKGKGEPIKIHRVLARAGDADSLGMALATLDREIERLRGALVELKDEVARGEGR